MLHNLTGLVTIFSQVSSVNTFETSEFYICLVMEVPSWRGKLSLRTGRSVPIQVIVKYRNRDTHEGYRYLRGMFVCFDAARDQWKLQLMTESENSDFSLTLSKLQLMNFRHASLVKKIVLIKRDISLLDNF